MWRQPTDRAAIEPALIEPLALTKGESLPGDVVSPPVTLPCEWRIGILLVIPTTAAGSELALRLRDSGYEVWAASTGRAAVELAERAVPDVILFDLDGMYEVGPEQTMISGFRVLHLLGQVRRERPMALVVMTSMDFAEVEGPVRASADDFVNKPIEPAQLLCRLRGALDRVRSRHWHHPQHRLTNPPAWQASR